MLFVFALIPGCVALRLSFARPSKSVALSDDDDSVGKLLVLESDSTLGEFVLVLDLRDVPGYSRCLGHSCMFQQSCGPPRQGKASRSSSDNGRSGLNGDTGVGGNSGRKVCGVAKLKLDSEGIL